MTVYLLLVDPTTADLALAGRVAGASATGDHVQVAPIYTSPSGPMVYGAHGRMGLRIELDRTVRRRPRPKRRIAPRVADLHTKAGTVPR